MLKLYFIGYFSLCNFEFNFQAGPVNKGPSGGNQYDCGVSGCQADLDPGCPDELRILGSSGSTVACASSCTKFATDQYCCRNAYGTPDTCHINEWAVNSASYFKANCPGAYSYAYDDTTSTYTCTDSAYRVSFYWNVLHLKIHIFWFILPVFFKLCWNIFCLKNKLYII